MSSALAKKRLELIKLVMEAPARTLDKLLEVAQPVEEEVSEDKEVAALLEALWEGSGYTEVKEPSFFEWVRTVRWHYNISLGDARALAEPFYHMKLREQAHIKSNDEPVEPSPIHKGTGDA